MRILLDLDQVTCDLHTEWLRRYNTRFDDWLKPEDVTSWDIQHLVKCSAAEIFGILNEPGLYEDVLPVEGAIPGIDRLQRDGHDIVFVTSCSSGEMVDGKSRWLERYGLAEGRVGSVPDNMIVARKKQFVDGDILVDDYATNVDLFPGLGVLMDAPYNQDAEPPVRVDNWDGIVRAVRWAAGSGAVEVCRRQ